ncbi:winged helix-turn-helix domain-containing protein [Glacieibacterium sp.]|uniref:winged helix-turn-helix domain-containing protein n=1 Tax=Glacieibacterium sp. TaxID=2860237 RepID=UPI003B0074F0
MTMIGLPPQPQVEEALTDYLLTIGEWVTPKTAYEALAKHFNLSPEQRKLTMAFDGRNHWENRVQYARQRLVARGVLDGSRLGFWKYKSN